MVPGGLARGLVGALTAVIRACPRGALRPLHNASFGTIHTGLLIQASLAVARAGSFLAGIILIHASLRGTLALVNIRALHTVIRAGGIGAFIIEEIAPLRTT